MNDSLEKIGHLTLIRQVGYLLLHAVQHLGYLDVGATMAGAFEGADACGDGGISICSAGGEHPSGKGGIVAAAVFCM